MKPKPRAGLPFPFHDLQNDALHSYCPKLLHTDVSQQEQINTLVTITTLLLCFDLYRKHKIEILFYFCNILKLTESVDFIHTWRSRPNNQAPPMGAYTPKTDDVASKGPGWPGGISCPTNPSTPIICNVFQLLLRQSLSTSWVTFHNKAKWTSCS